MLHEEKLLKVKKFILLPLILLSIVLLTSTKIPDIKKPEMTKKEKELEEQEYVLTKDFLFSFDESILYRMVKINDPKKALVALRVLLVANEEKIPRGIALSLVIQENPQMNPYAVSDRNTDGSVDYGIGQLNSRWISEFEEKYWNDEDGEFNKFNIEHNATISFRMLKKLYNKYDSWYLALKAYNGGASRVYTNISTKYANEILQRSIKLYNEKYS